MSVMCWSHVSHVLVMGQSRVTYAAHLITCQLWLNHVSVMCWTHFNSINCDSHVKYVGHMSVLSGQSCVSLVSHVSHMLVTCQSLVKHRSRFTHVLITCHWCQSCYFTKLLVMFQSCFNHMSVVLVTCQSCYCIMLVTSVSITWLGDHMSITCESCWTRANHVWWSRANRVSRVSIICQWSTGLASDTCQTRSCVDCANHVNHLSHVGRVNNVSVMCHTWSRDDHL